MSKEYRVRVYGELSGVAYIMVEADNEDHARELAETEVSAEDFIPAHNPTAELYLEKITDVTDVEGLL